MHLPIKNVTFTKLNPEFKKTTILNQLFNLNLSYKKYLNINDKYSDPLSNKSLLDYSFCRPIFLLTVGSSAILIALCVALCIGCVLNTLKISIENNAHSIGIMLSLGMRNRDIHKYLFVQMVFLIIVAVLLAMLISWALKALIFPFLVSTILAMMFGASAVAIGASFNIFVPIISLALLILVVFLATIKMLKRYLMQSTIAVLQEVAE